MTQHSFRNLKITRGLTAVCTCVLLLVSVYSFSLGIQRSVFSSKKAMSNNASSGKVIIIDPGHGGEDGGAQSESGILEKHINMSISNYLNELFSFFGYDTVMTRTDDRLIYDSGCNTIREKKVSDIHNRMTILENNPDAVFLSIHQNHFDGSSCRGTQVFYSGNNDRSERIAQSIQETVVSDIQQDNKRKIKKSGSEIYLLCHAESPAVMVECGFLSNPEEAQKLNTDEYQKIMAFEIFKGTVNSGG